MNPNQSKRTLGAAVVLQRLVLALVKSVERMDYPTMTTQAGCEALEAFQAVMRMATAKLTVLAEVM